MKISGNITVNIERHPGGRAALEVVRTLREKGCAAYIVGGAVRDMVLGREPGDFDVATDAEPKEITVIFPHTVPVGAQFGTILVVVEGRPVQVSTLRKRPGEPVPSIEEAILRDAELRDFTVNALFLDVEKKYIIDPLGGLEDVQSRLLRTALDPVDILTDDPARILRAVRLAANNGLSLDGCLSEAMIDSSSHLMSVAPERVRDELVRMLTGHDPGRALELMSEHDLLTFILPEVEAMKGVRQPDCFHPEGDVYTHVKLMMGMLRNPVLVLALAALLHDVGKPLCRTKVDRIRFYRHDQVGAQLADDILKRLRFPNSVRAAVVACVENHMKFKDALEMRQGTLKRLLSRKTFPVEMELHRLDCLASHGDMRTWEFLSEQYRIFLEEGSRPQPLLRGGDLLTLGFPEGPLIGQALGHIESLQLEGTIHTREEALAEAERWKKVNG
ncbi:MAG: CCA tRNA nucleotidyltransferase [Deltaproteobacteria bacterium]|nr:CCA tRNA nucleotidyltransferase [Deltaproteobacteria bacterium]MBW2309196.1 CCA tRNA nucleotidyltransferase [Deltaproteobacteria bacterium]